MEQLLPVPELPDSPPASGAPYWYWLGGRPALDFVNTRRERWRRDVECLVTADDLGRWLHAAGLVRAWTPLPAGILDDARRLREAVDAAVVAAVAGSPPGPTAIEVIDRWLVLAGPRPKLALDDRGLPLLGERAVADSPKRALGMLALDAARVLGTDDERARLRICAAEDCSARFYDRSPAGRRRWCSMRACGNVAKARRHRARLRAEPLPEPAA